MGCASALIRLLSSECDALTRARTVQRQSGRLCDAKRGAPRMRRAQVEPSVALGDRRLGLDRTLELVDVHGDPPPSTFGSQVIESLAGTPFQTTSWSSQNEGCWLSRTS
jgi:hypothetical protein